MKLAINFSTLKKGGGQNVAFNFLNVFFDQSSSFNLGDVYYIVAKNSSIHDKLRQQVPDYNIIVVPQNPVKRIISEVLCVSPKLKKLNISIVYSYFGFGIYPSSIPQIVGSADSNLYYPEVNFWSQYHGYKLLIKKFIDSFRIWGLKRASGIVFETSILELRSKKILGFKALTKTIMPSISVPKENNKIELPQHISDKYKGLLLCSWQLNKNIMMVPFISRALKDRKIPFVFLITAPLDGSAICKEFAKFVKEMDVEDYIQILGSVSKDKLASLYSQIDIVFLLSKLESFSNNIIEAWYFKKPLIVSDEDWAHDICKDGAAFVNRDNYGDISVMIEKILSDNGFVQNLIEKGISNIAEYPSIQERTRQEIEFIKQVYEAIN